MPSRRESNPYPVVFCRSYGVFNLAFSCSQEQFWVDTTGIVQDNDSLTLLMYAHVLHTFM